MEGYVLERLFGGKQARKERKALPEAFMPEDPVNYNSVLDYLVGLSRADYNKMVKSAEVYREANAKVAKIVGIKDEPTTSIQVTKPEITEADLDNLLDSDDIVGDFLDDGPEVPKPKKAQSSDKKVKVED